jgi:hypothetical protein
MIMFAGYGWIDYQEVKRAWKVLGMRGTVTGYPWNRTTKSAAAKVPSMGTATAEP